MFSWPPAKLGSNVVCLPLSDVCPDIPTSNAMRMSPTRLCVRDTGAGRNRRLYQLELADLTTMPLRLEGISGRVNRTTVVQEDDTCNRVDRDDEVCGDV